MGIFDSFSSSDSSSYDFASDPQGAVGGGGHDMGPSDSGGAAGSLDQMKSLMIQEQQKAIIQQAIARITEIAWDKCSGKPDVTLSNREVTCIQNVTGTFLDSSQFIVSRLSKQ